MKRSAGSTDERQGALFAYAPPVRPKTSDEQARAEMLEMVELLTKAKTHPWSARLLGWKVRTFNVLAQRVTPIDAAALSARLQEELERLGPTED